MIGIAAMVGMVAAAFVVLGSLALVVRGAIRARRAKPEIKEDPPCSTWRLLVSRADLHDAIDRAIACEHESIRQSQVRTERYDAMRTRAGPVATIQSIEPRRPQQVTDQPIDRVSCRVPSESPVRDAR